MSANVETGRQPVNVYKCCKCGRVSRVEWVDGTHVRQDASDQKDRCDGQAEHGYFISADEYLDWLLARKDAP